LLKPGINFPAGLDIQVVRSQDEFEARSLINLDKLNLAISNGRITTTFIASGNTFSSEAPFQV